MLFYVWWVRFYTKHVHIPCKHYLEMKLGTRRIYRSGFLLHLDSLLRLNCVKVLNLGWLRSAEG